MGIHPGKHCQVFIYLYITFFCYKDCCQALSRFLDGTTIEMILFPQDP